MPVIEEFCTLTSKGQATIPKSVRQALGVGQGDRIAFRIDGNSVTVEAVGDEHDPALGPFLDLLAADIAANPSALQPLTQAQYDELRALTDGVPVDLDEEIDGPAGL